MRNTSDLLYIECEDLRPHIYHLPMQIQRDLTRRQTEKAAIWEEILDTGIPGIYLAITSNKQLGSCMCPVCTQLPDILSQTCIWSTQSEFRKFQSPLLESNPGSLV